MSDTEKRVVACFANVFPGLDEDGIRGADTESLSAWDSLAHVTLLAALAEEFGLSLELEDLESLTSFPLVLARFERDAST